MPRKKTQASYKKKREPRRSKPASAPESSPTDSVRVRIRALVSDTLEAPERLPDVIAGTRLATGRRIRFVSNPSPSSSVSPDNRSSSSSSSSSPVSETRCQFERRIIHEFYEEIHSSTTIRNQLGVIDRGHDLGKLPSDLHPPTSIFPTNPLAPVSNVPILTHGPHLFTPGQTPSTASTPIYQFNPSSNPSSVPPFNSQTVPNATSSPSSQIGSRDTVNTLLPSLSSTHITSPPSSTPTSQFIPAPNSFALPHPVDSRPPPNSTSLSTSNVRVSSRESTHTAPQSLLPTVDPSLHTYIDPVQNPIVHKLFKEASSNGALIRTVGNTEIILPPKREKTPPSSSSSSIRSLTPGSYLHTSNLISDSLKEELVRHRRDRGGLRWRQHQRSIRFLIDESSEEEGIPADINARMEWHEKRLCIQEILFPELYNGELRSHPGEDIHCPVFYAAKFNPFKFLLERVHLQTIEVPRENNFWKELPFYAHTGPVDEPVMDPFLAKIYIAMVWRRIYTASEFFTVMGRRTVTWRKLRKMCNVCKIYHLRPAEGDEMPGDYLAHYPCPLDID